jgi:hypothetical protein
MLLNAMGVAPPHMPSIYDGGAYRCKPGFGASRVLGRIGLEAGMAALGMKFSGFDLCFDICFVAGTPVATPDGYKPIEQIKAGNQVISRDTATGATAPREVLSTSKRTVTELIVVELADAATGKVVETVRATPEHPVFVDGTGWTPLEKVGVGTSIVTRAGPDLIVRSVTRERRPEGVAVYNFEVQVTPAGEDSDPRALGHSYFVGTASGGVWVHNTCLNRGGRFADLNRMKAAGEVGHHMQQNAANRLIGRSRADGPAVGMTHADHALTRTFRGRGRVTLRLERGPTSRQRLARDIRDMRTLFGKKYEQGIREMLEYARTLSEYQ